MSSLRDLLAGIRGPQFTPAKPVLGRNASTAQLAAAFTTVSKQNAQSTKTLEGQTSTLPGNGGVMPGTPVVTRNPLTGTVSPTFGPTFAPMSSPVSAGDIATVLTPGCAALPSPLKEICQGVGTLVSSPKPTTSGSTTQSTGTTLQQATCPPGTVRVGDTCISPGDLFPGGAPGFIEAGGQAVVGAFGLPALSPTIVGSVASSRGVSPIRRCPRGMVLGFDELCYAKQLLPRRSKFRKHKGDRRPPMTGADAAALRRIGTLQKRVKELAKDAGISCSTRRRK